MTGQQDSELPWGTDAADDVIEQGRERPGPGGPGRFRWRPRVGKVTTGLVAAALAVGLLGGYLAGDAHGRGHAPVPQPRAQPLAAESFGLAETGSQCSTMLGPHTFQLGIEVVNGSAGAIRVGPVTARFPQGGLKLTATAWAPCGTLPYAYSAVNSELPLGASTWLSVTVSTAGQCPAGLPVEYVASYSQDGETFTVALPGFADLGGVPVAGCPSS